MEEVKLRSPVMHACIQCCVLCKNPRNVSIAFDEMKIHEDLVFDRDGEIVGFVDTGDFNNKLRLLEERCNGSDTDEIATHMLTLMVRGIFIKLNFPYAQFPTSGIMVHANLC